MVVWSTESPRDLITAWRIVKTKYAAQAFDGEGARRYGGRWNSPGTSVVYVAESRALAALEMLVHLQSSEILKSYSLIPVAFPGDLVTSVTREDLPSDWRAFPSPAALQTIGDEWVARSDSLVLKVPSVAIDEEHDYLINPEHSGFPKILIGTPEPFEFDRRLMK